MEILAVEPVPGQWFVFLSDLLNIRIDLEREEITQIILRHDARLKKLF